MLKPGDYMKKILLALLFVAGLCSMVRATDLFYENDGQITAPPDIAPNIDAVNFINNGRFVINLTNATGFPSDFPPPQGLLPYETQNTFNYSNLFGHFMSCNTGFMMDTYN